MMVRLLLAASVALLALTSTVQAQCGFGGLDFSSLKGSDIMGLDGSSPVTYNYYMSVCGPLSSSATAPCTQIMSSASACQIQVSGGTGTYDVGNWVTSPPPTWGYIDPNNQALGVMYTLGGAQACWAHPPVQQYTANILFVCNPNTQGPLTVTVPQGSCIQNYTYPTPLACGGGPGPAGPGGDGGSPKKGLSGGWIFIIILCVVIPVYVVVGCVYKSQKLGATGMEKCPNVEFWRDLPGLVKDGCGFTYRKLRGLCAGGGGGGKDGSYETM